jgi:DNA-binding MarR family transcriptional regulator
MTSPNWLTVEEERAWRAYRRMQEALAAQLGRDLAHDSNLSDADYEVLSTLSEQVGHRWQLRDLAAKMHWSRSRLSHHVNRMEQRGLVARDDDPEDRRGCMISLTDQGLRVLKRAAAFHVASVRLHFIDLLTPDDLAALTAISQRVSTHLDDYGRVR